MEQRHSEEVDLGETTPDTGELQLNKSDNHNPELNIEEIPPDVGHAWLQAGLAVDSNTGPDIWLWKFHPDKYCNVHDQHVV
ncbi:hypothetical protein AX774_g505 [Zancudomyces culisetae]|uniref:Uncharacterized protein n=1 Tax=Zancudomyces culisetae TaxID=1213189 RepID=A0A1R1PY81_ZANCU|nr:hypothetical protein AX774_g505 [Zancudomyces culisetae]|eukprot:OMH85924.1 hypothetical protein AX774_g505 [Zancudomyces culisetae]